MRAWQDPAEEQALYRRAEATRLYIRRVAATATPAQARAVSDLRANYPWMRPGTAYPLAQSGRPVDDPDIKEFARREAIRNKGQTGSWMGLGVMAGSPFEMAGHAASFGVGALNWAGDKALDILKPTTRTLTALASAPLEEAQGLYRNLVTGLPGQTGEIAGGAVGGAATGAALGSVVPGLGTAVGAIGGGVIGGLAGAFAPEVEGTPQFTTQSTLGRALLNQGLKPEEGQPAPRNPIEALGQGFLPGGPAAVQQREIAVAAASINGAGVTPGRLIASAVVEPGSTPYNLASGLIDAGIALKGDPGALALSRASRARQASRLFSTATGEQKAARAAAGLIEGPSKGIIAENVGTWLSSRDGVDTLGWLAKEGDFETLRAALPRVDVETILDLKAARTPEEVSTILRPKLGLERGLSEKPRVGGAAFAVKRELSSRVRLFNAMPGGKIDFHDPTNAVEEFGRLQRNANFGTDVISKNNERFAELLVSGDTAGARRMVLNEFLGGMSSPLAKRGVDPSTLRRLNNRVTREMDEMAADLREQVALTSGDLRVGLGGKDATLPLPGMLSEVFDNGIKFDLDDIRDMRRLTSKYARVVSHPTWKTTVAGMDWLMTELWKPMQLIRGAWTTRVLGEEQVRLAAAGNDSLFRHPLSYVAWLADDEGRIGRALRKAGVKPRGGTDWLGDEFSEAPADLEALLRGEANEFADALNRRRTTAGLQGKSLVQAPNRVSLRPGDEGYQQALAERLHQLHRDPFIRRIAQRPSARGAQKLPWETTDFAADPELRGALDLLAKEPGGAGLGVRYGRVQDPQAFDQWLNVRLRNVNQVAGSDAALWDAVATGRLGDISMTLPDGRINPEFANALGSYADRGVTPPSVLGDGWTKATLGDKYNRTMDSLFSGFMATPQAVLSRSPHYRQELWKVAEELIPEMSKADQARLLENARKARLKPDQIKRLEGRAALATGELSLDDALLLGKARALDAVKGLLYDASERSNLSDVMRIIWPFAEAQKEVLTRWMKLSTENLAVPYRATQVVEGARGAGFFTTDEQTGDELFVYPGSSFITEKFLGIPVPLTGRVQGLNVFGSGILPGLGPVVQLPTRWFVPDKPEYDELRTFLDPFGTSADTDEGLLEQNYPSWFQKVRAGLTGPEDDRIFGNTIFDVWRSGVSSGRYGTDTPEEIQEGLEDAKNQAKKLYLIRGAAQAFGAPVSPTPEFLAMDKDGRWLVADKLVQDYRAMMDDEAAGGIDTASARFLDKYGNNAFAWMQSRTYVTGAAAPTTPEFSEWIKENGEVKEKFPETYALFAPQGEEFDYVPYARQLRTGERKTLTPEQAAQQANARVAGMIYHQAKDRFGPHPSKPQREAISQIRDLLKERFPGYGEELPGKPDQRTVVEKFIPQIRKAVEDPSLAGNDVAAATRIYLQARDAVDAMAVQSGRAGFSQAKELRPLRDALRQIGELLIDRVPDFQTTFDMVFEREMIDDMTEEPTPALIGA